jgi:predicted nucleic acid-binding protein
MIIPTAVSREIAPSVSRPAWVEVRGLAQPVSSIVLRVSLGAGESEAISLAIETKARLLLLDDLAARRLALGLHLSIIGTLGLLLAAKRKGLLETVKPSLDQLMACEFRVSADLYDRLLRDAGEAPAHPLG